MALDNINALLDLHFAQLLLTFRNIAFYCVTMPY